MSILNADALDIAQNESSREIRQAINTLFHALGSKAGWASSTNFDRVDALRALSIAQESAKNFGGNAETRHYLNSGSIVRLACSKLYGTTPAGGSYASSFAKICKLDKKTVTIALLRIDEVDGGRKVFKLAEPNALTSELHRIKYSEIAELLFDAGTQEWKSTHNSPTIALV